MKRTETIITDIHGKEHRQPIADGTLLCFRVEVSRVNKNGDTSFWGRHHGSTQGYVDLYVEVTPEISAMIVKDYYPVEHVVADAPSSESLLLALLAHVGVYPAE